MTWRDRRMTLTLDGSAHKQDRAFGVYLAFATGANLLWEVLQLPLYTLWTTGSVREQVFAIAHCTAGDVLISTAALVAALLVFGDRRWPHKHFGRVAAATIAIGAGYTIYSEWVNTYGTGELVLCGSVCRSCPSLEPASRHSCNGLSFPRSR